MKKESNVKLLVGLGNPGIEYQKTRHNLGFQVIAHLANKLNLPWQKEKFKGLYTTSIYLKQKIMLLKPLTYMNNSGECIRDFVNYWQIPLANILVIYDDLSLPLGTFRYRQQGSSGGHNGVKNIIECLGTQNFKRLKIGIGPKRETLGNDNYQFFRQKGSIKDWVCQKFTQEEVKEIEKILPDLVDKLLEWLGNNTDNSGAKELLIIRCLGGSNRKFSHIGDRVIATVKKVDPHASNIKKGQIVTALIITSKKGFHRTNGNFVGFSKNYAVLIKKEDQQLIGTRILVPILRDLVKVITGKFRGLVDNIHHLEPKKEQVYLTKAARKTYNKSPDVKKKSRLKDVLVPLHISNVMACKEELSPKKSSLGQKKKKVK
ncbi:2060_t:CDS:2 [Entrophospora sp. SA101]|nr:14088_t:CDS:2 [Entrophospora sp. SA101]CAJ0836319.1 2060_t:CDS:2 [Entrophospora sp. SA101]